MCQRDDRAGVPLGVRRQRHRRGLRSPVMTPRLGTGRRRSLMEAVDTRARSRRTPSAERAGPRRGKAPCLRGGRGRRRGQAFPPYITLCTRPVRMPAVVPRVAMQLRRCPCPGTVGGASPRPRRCRRRWQPPRGRCPQGAARGQPSVGQSPSHRPVAVTPPTSAPRRPAAPEGLVQEEGVRRTG